MKARKVRQSTLRMVSQHVDIEDLYITQTIEQSDASLDEIIKKRYPLVLCGGGDGTVMRIIEQMRLKVNRLNEAGGDYTVPRFGILKLGTGNGWAWQLGVPPKVEPIWRLRQLRDEDLRFAKFNMMEAEERMFHFGGMGVDALVLNDYINLKNKFTKGFLWKMSNSLIGYLWAIAFSSVPTVLFKKFHIDMKVTNLSSEPVYRISHSEGVRELPAKPGDVIYEGSSLIAGFGTTENYGYGLKVYPFSMAKPGYFNFRVADVTATTVLSHIKTVWNGTWEEPGLNDFLVKHILIETQSDAPFQLGGDPEGYRRQVEVKLSDFMPEMLDLNASLAAMNEREGGAS